MKKLRGQPPPHSSQAQVESEEEKEQDIADYSYEDEGRLPRFNFEEIRPAATASARASTIYEGNPFDLDRVNTKESFKSGKNKSRDFLGLNLTNLNLSLARTHSSRADSTKEKEEMEV